jgi:type IV pilus assembly protein PilW
MMIALQSKNGYTLIEIMVALGVSSILMAGLARVFTDVSTTYRLEVAMARVQEDGRFVINFLEKEFRLIGYQGCIDPEITTANVIANNPPVLNVTQSSLAGYEITASGWTPAITADIADLNGVAIEGSDVIKIQRVSDRKTDLSGNMASDNANVQLASNPVNFQANDLLAITDCETVDVFRATNVSSGSGTVTIAHANSANTTNNLSKAYGTDASVMEYNSNTFYVADTGRDNSSGNPVHALYQRDAGGLTSELVEGVSNLQILYGEELADGNVRFVPASTATLDMSNVKSIRFGVLVQSNNGSLDADDDKSYTLPGDTIFPAGTTGATATYAVDATLKRVFISTEKLRNRN